MEPKTVYDLSDICESVFTGKPLTEAEDDENKKKDDEEDKSDSPFADTSDGDTEDTKEDDTDDESDTETQSDSPFGGDTTNTTDDEPASDDDEGDENGVGAPMDEEDTPPEGETVTTEYDELGQLGIEIIMLAAQVHFWHINCRKGSQHNAFDTLYHMLQSNGDRLLEAVISRTNQSIVANGELSFDFGDLDFDQEESLGILEDVRDHVNEVAGSFSEDQTFANVLGDISEDLSSAIYKLSRFDSGTADNG